MAKKQTDTQEKIQTRTTSLQSIYDRILIRLDLELDNLPEILQSVSPEKRLEWITKTIPLLLKYRESGQGSGESWLSNWGD